MEQLNNNVIGEFFEKLGILEENDRDEFFKKIDEKHKVNLTQDLDLAVALRKDKIGRASCRERVSSPV